MRDKIRRSAIKLLDLDTEPMLKPINYKYHSDNCNCNKGLLPATFGNISILVDKLQNGAITLNQSIILSGVETDKIDTHKHKVICKICNQFIRF